MNFRAKLDEHPTWVCSTIACAAFIAALTLVYLCKEILGLEVVTRGSYIMRSEVEDRYIAKDQLEGAYVSKSRLASEYISRLEVQREYVPKSSSRPEPTAKQYASGGTSSMAANTTGINSVPDSRGTLSIDQSAKGSGLITAQGSLKSSILSYNRPVGRLGDLEVSLESVKNDPVGFLSLTLVIENKPISSYQPPPLYSKSGLQIPYSEIFLQDPQNNAIVVESLGNQHHFQGATGISETTPLKVERLSRKRIVLSFSPITKAVEGITFRATFRQVQQDESSIGVIEVPEIPMRSSE